MAWGYAEFTQCSGGNEQGDIARKNHLVCGNDVTLYGIAHLSGFGMQSEYFILT
jgi:hypothetical protein